MGRGLRERLRLETCIQGLSVDSVEAWGMNKIALTEGGQELNGRGKESQTRSPERNRSAKAGVSGD